MGQILADLGADVVKVERRGSGDETRQWGPPFLLDDSGEVVFSAYFQTCNRGKRSVEADYSTEEGRTLISRLASVADIVIENFKVGTLARYGLAPERLCQANPRLIWCSITGFGQTGPYAKRPGYDFIIQAMSGLLALNSLGTAQKRRVPIPTSDLLTGVYGAVAVLAVLNQRHATGRGAILDLSLFETQIGTLSQYFLRDAVGSESNSASPDGPMVPQIVVPTADGSVALAPASDPHFQHLVTGLEAGELAKDERFRDNASRRANIDALTAALSRETRRFGTAEIIGRMERLGVPAGPVNSLTDVVEDVHLHERKVFVSIPGPAGRSSAVPAVRMPILFNGIAAEPDRGAPRLGEHNNDFTADSGWPSSDAY
jgi:crotonobetainyl-CoA:carnitine CoA-transferase CaiB-like acyl-CoA transferase